MPSTILRKAAGFVITQPCLAQPGVGTGVVLRLACREAWLTQRGVAGVGARVAEAVRETEQRPVDLAIARRRQRRLVPRLRRSLFSQRHSKQQCKASSYLTPITPFPLHASTIHTIALTPFSCIHTILLVLIVHLLVTHRRIVACGHGFMNFFDSSDRGIVVIRHVMQAELGVWV